MMSSRYKCKTLAIIFVLVCAISTCSSSPLKTSTYVSELKRRRIGVAEQKVRLLSRASDGCADLLKRQESKTMSFSKFEEILSDSDTVYVDTGDQQYRSFKDGPVTMGSDGFHGCIGIVISSPKGGIIAHYTATSEGTEKGKKALAELIREHKDNFKEGESEAFVFANVSPNDHDKFVNEEQKDTFVKLIEDEVGITPKIEKYLQLSDMIEDGDIDEGNIDLKEDQLETLKGGAILLKNKGGGEFASEILFVDVAAQTAGESCEA